MKMLPTMWSGRPTHTPKCLMENLEDKRFLVWRAEAGELSSVFLAEPVSLNPSQPLLQRTRMEDLREHADEVTHTRHK